ncbi:hypothetical protein [Qipengyuania atrilutea]|uniref:DUF3618 domain-containing protein n=1 Tax=Qipengyuania atrilutea TaxID=2744473 RepID=A0A850H4E1_9SPHN|nr:hypothetical protein [Actirhodobacter atriluteus]NVD45387.1 hypothetical protein [Actirhodobacter atriluteus]
MAETSPNTTSTARSSDVAQDLKGDARELKDTAVKQGEAKAGKEKDRVGRMAHSASSAMQTAADELRNDDQSPDWLASAFSSIAREVDGLATRLQDKSPRELASETRRFARDNPSAFLGASAVAGFAAARFLRAGAEYHDDYDVGSDEQGQEYGSADRADRSGSPTSRPMSTGIGDRSQTVAQAQATAGTTRPTGGTR